MARPALGIALTLSLIDWRPGQRLLTGVLQPETPLSGAGPLAGLSDGSALARTLSQDQDYVYWVDRVRPADPHEPFFYQLMRVKK